MPVKLQDLDWLIAHADNAFYWQGELEKTLAQLALWRAKIESKDFVVLKLIVRTAIPNFGKFIYDDDLPPNP